MRVMPYNHGVYVTYKRRTVHIVRFDDYHELPNPRTLCGRHLGSFGEAGDETVSGNAATCKRCVRIFRRKP